MRMVSETCTVMVDKGEMAKFIADKIKDGWQVDSTRPGAPGSKDGEVTLHLSKQHPEKE